MQIADSHDRFEFTAEQIRVLESHRGEPLQVPVQETDKVYLVIEQGDIPTLDQDYIRQGLSLAADQATRGDEADWDAEEIKAVGRKLLSEAKRQS